MRWLPLLLCVAWLGRAVAAAAAPVPTDRFFTTSDGVRLHYLQAGPATARTIVFIPGWTMPCWIFSPQIAAFSRYYRVIAFDPRGQGLSDIPDGGYDQARRGQDIAELLRAVGGAPPVLVGWSLGVLDTLAYVHEHGDADVAGLVLIDNSVGENPPPVPERLPPGRGPALSHAAYMQRFVAGMFTTPQPRQYLQRLTEAALRTPAPDAALLLRYPVPRSYWRQAILASTRPVLYVVRPGLRGQADNLLLDRPNTDIAIFAGAGHALFVDQAGRFDALLAHFLEVTVWP